MNVRVNGRKVNTGGMVSILELLAILKTQKPDQVYVCINGRLLLGEDYEMTYVRENDVIEVGEWI